MIRTLIACMAVLSFVQEDKRAEPPDAAAQKSAEKLMRDVFKEEFAKKGLPDRIALAKKLIQQASETKDDPVARFVLLKEAQDLARHTGDLPTALQAIELQGQHYRVDVPALKAAALAAAEKSSKTPPELRQLIEQYLEFADTAAAADRIDLAEKAAAAAGALARKAKELALVTRSEAKGKELLGLKSKLDRLKKAKTILIATPEDGAANALVGYHECTVKGNWAAGLAMLAKGSDPSTQAIAQKDLSEPKDAPEQVAVADGWWGLSEKETGIAREQLRERATVWYERAIPRLTGLSLAKADKRASEVRNDRLMKGTWIDMTDTPGINIGVKKGEALVLDGSKADTGVHADIDRFTSGVYDGFSVRFKILDGTAGQARLKFESQNRLIWVDPGAGKLTAISRPRGTQNWATDFDKAVVVAEEPVVTVLFESGAWVVYLDGREMVRLKTDLVHLESLGFVAFKNKVAYKQMLLRRKE
jgi:hypothetical protein